MTVEDYAIETVERQRRLNRALSKMSNDAQRLTVILYLMGYRHGEIAEVYHCSRQRISQTVIEFKRRNGLHLEGEA